MPAGDAHWKVGVINTPASNGSVSYTGLGGTPKAVWFWGTNWTTEDSIVTGGGQTIFRGVAGEDYSSPGTIIQNSSSLAVSGVEHVTLQSAVFVLDSALSGTLNRADLTSFDADGFTLDWTTGNAGYKVIYVALMDVANSGSFELVGSATASFGWKAGAALLQGAWGGPSIAGGTRNQEYFGGGAYPTGSVINWMGAGLTSFVFPTAPAQQYNIGIYDQNPNSLVVQGGNFIGPFLSTQDITAEPTGGGLTDFTVDTNTVDNAVIATAWDDEASATGRLVPSSSPGGVVTVSGLPFAPGFLTGYSISDEPQGQGSGTIFGAVGFAVVAPGFQWSALIDRTPGPSAFQSFQRGVIDTVSPTTVHDAQIDLTTDGFTVTTEENSAAPSSWVWHAFGHPEDRVMWIPHIYRRILG